jgi:hypothetical protein
MDLNELLFHHQIALIGEAEDQSAGRERLNLVAHYAGRLQELQSRLGVSHFAQTAA